MRPTGDRVRETLFNWLAPVIEGARCLDLFAGSGSLGLEALSRGAGETVFVELEPAAAAQLERNLERLECREASVVRADALRFLDREPRRFDLVFLDPPFGTIDPANLCTLLQRGWLAEGALVYLESSRRGDPPALPAGWVVDHEKAAGQVRFALVKPGRDAA